MLPTETIKCPAGIWGEFRQKIWNHYGGPQAVATGWVSNTAFEPSVGATIFQQMANSEPNLEVQFEMKVDTIVRNGTLWDIMVQDLRKGGSKTIQAKIVIDGTELGDIAAMTGAQFDVGMDTRRSTGESMALQEKSPVIQDLTYAAILKDYGPDADRSMPKPSSYDSNRFLCSCLTHCPNDSLHACSTMLDYAKLPNNKYLINWPTNGNDFYANTIPLSETERGKVYQSAKNRTLQFVYFIQQELGYKHLGLSG